MISKYLNGIYEISRNQYFLILTTLLLFFIGLMRYLDSFLITDLSPNGIVSFELAKEIDISLAIINSWDETARTAAGMSMGFDFIFLIIYSLAIAELIQVLNNKLWKSSSFHTIGRIFLKAIFLAAIFDIIENIALIQLLLGDIDELWSNTAYYFALSKFILIVICFTYIVINASIFLVKKIKYE